MLRHRADLRNIDRAPYAAVGERPLVHFDAHVAVGNRDEIAPQAPGAAAVPSAHFEHVAKAARGDDADPGAATLEQRVGADGGAVHDRIDGGTAAERFQAIQKALRLVAAMRRHLCGEEPAGRRIQQEQIGEGPADVDPDDDAATVHAGVPARAFTVASASSEPSSRSTTL